MANVLFHKIFLAKITAIIHTFWWQGVHKDQQKSPSTKIMGLHLQTKKKEGGLGIRNLELVNKGMLISTAWCFVNEPDTTTSKIIKAKFILTILFGMQRLIYQNPPSSRDSKYQKTFGKKCYHSDC
jgi:hypothetical protein